MFVLVKRKTDIQGIDPILRPFIWANFSLLYLESCSSSQPS